jgi:hypothetical protein
LSAIAVNWDFSSKERGAAHTLSSWRINLDPSTGREARLPGTSTYGARPKAVALKKRVACDRDLAFEAVGERLFIVYGHLLATIVASVIGRSRSVQDGHLAVAQAATEVLDLPPELNDR